MTALPVLHSIVLGEVLEALAADTRIGHLDAVAVAATVMAAVDSTVGILEAR